MKPIRICDLISRKHNGIDKMIRCLLMMMMMMMATNNDDNIDNDYDNDKHFLAQGYYLNCLLQKKSSRFFAELNRKRD